MLIASSIASRARLFAKSIEYQTHTQEDDSNMAGNRTICTTNNVDYSTIRRAMCNGARTFQEIQDMTGVCGTCPGCQAELDSILSSVCGCHHVSLQAVIDAVKNGADTVEKVGSITGAGTDCGRCKALVANVIALGR